MTELNVLIEAKKQSEGELLSAWFELPIDEDEFFEKIGVSVESTDYKIIEKQLPFPDDVGEDTTVERLNDLYELFMDLPRDIQEECSAFLDYYFSLDELHHHRYDMIHYAGCKSMEDVARYILSENPEFQSLSEQCIRYFDFEAYGEYLNDNGNFLETEQGIYELA